MSKGAILIMAGGTGGHIYPALAVAGALQQRSQPVLWLGTQRGLEARIVPAAGIEVEWINIQGLRGKGALAVLLAPFRLLYAVSQSLGVMIRHRPSAVLGMGGFVSGPGGLAAWLTRRPLIIHEQNAVAGLTNRLLARLARVVLQAFPGSFKERLRPETVGNPVRADIAAIAPPEMRYAERSGPLRLLVLGGSQGALSLNRTIPQAIALLAESQRPEILHQAGERTLQIALDVYAEAGVVAEVTPYIENMAEAYSWADLVVCRSGALTVAEIAAAGLPAIFVPYPAAVDDHQTANAAAMQNIGSATIINEAKMTADGMSTTLGAWLHSRNQLCERAVRARGLAAPEALARITDVCLNAAGGRND